MKKQQQNQNNIKNNRNSQHFLEARSISFSYNNVKKTGRTLNSVSFFVNKGERIAILGHNGSGKSTLTKILGGLLEPDEGECLIEGVNIKKFEFRDLRKKIGMVFQDPENQIVAAIVEDDVAFAPENQGLPPQEIQIRVDKALEETNLLHKKNSSVSALSGGEKQRVALAGALAANVECLILDEPTAMLDPKSRHKVEKILRFIHGEGMTILQITHQIETENFDDFDRILVLSKGEFIWQGSTQEFWNNAENLGFEVPDEIKIKKFFTDKKINFPEDLANAKFFYPESSDNSAKIKNPEKKFEIKNLSFKYNENENNEDDKNNFALKNLNSEIFSGQWLSIIGQTGSGKSTLVQHLNALYKIQSGEIFFDSENLPQKGEEVHALRKKVGLVFQHPEDQLFSPTVKEELAFSPKNAGLKNSELNNAILYGLECVGLEKNFLERNPLALSGGERRLVAIASVLATRPECVILDEPLAGLDAFYQKKILSMLKNLSNSGTTIITITHDLDTALKFSDRILILSGGEKIKEGEPYEIIEEIMSNLEPESWPDVLKASAEIRKFNKNFPLIYDFNEFIKCFSQI